MAVLTIPLNDWANRIFVWCLSLTVLVLSCLAASSCRFVRVTTFNSGTGSYSVTLGGLYQFYNPGTGQCISYSLPLDAADPTDPNRLIISGSHKAAKAFAIIAAFLAGVAMFILLAPLLRTLSKGLWRTAGGLLAASAVFQALTFLIFNDDQCKTNEQFPSGGGSVQCSVDKGSNFAIAAIVVGFLAATVVFRTPPPEKEPLLSFRSDPEEEKGDEGAAAPNRVTEDEDTFGNEQEAYPHAAAGASLGMDSYGTPSHRAPGDSQQEIPKGARRTVTETVNADGSKTVYITTTMEGGTAQSASSAGSSSNADYGHSVRHSRSPSGGGRDLGGVGEAGEV
eukprot:CAMPEP_0197468620 /NCGR_PEP_ID=MMETSP1175-20131217/66173_1 /TAXON_ID=1003142 /ORGANISM="Triceratium dubium, Strain CCMP147" /LENGTH=337 /DNA_ID=CAMNT_0043004723 /DNA_START=743 /DNA_END=1756 /DNA_ORIENTATION=-